MTGFRVPDRGRIDRSRRLRFSFDGLPYEGFAGDTLASALLANGVTLFGRSFKYHRPRGILASGSEEPNALVTIDRGDGHTTPNTRATAQELFEGLRAESQNRWPSLRYDFGALNDVLHSLIPAGFYYKTFLWPKSFWRALYEPLIRRASGLGRAPSLADPDLYTSRYAHCEVLVVGAGPAGIAAALAASERGERTILVDEQAEIGGSLLGEPSSTIARAPAAGWLEDARARLASRGNVTVLARTTAIGAWHANMIVLAERLTDHLTRAPADLPRERLWRVRARDVVLASGATERPLVFAGNDRPGVMLAGAARTYLIRYGVAVGRNVAVFTRDDSAWGTAFDLAAAGATIAAIVDLRREVDEALVKAAGKQGIETFLGSAVTSTHGRRAVKAIEVRVGDSSRSQRIACDVLLMCGGWVPNVHLFSHARGQLAWRDDIEAYVPDRTMERMIAVGAANGTFDLAGALAEGSAAGGRAGIGPAPAASRRIVAGNRPQMVHPANSGRAFVDFQNDVTADDLRLAVREGFRSVEHIKRYTTAGMATDQGRTANINALAISAAALDRSVPEIGLTTFRPPYTPTTFGALAGHTRGDFFAPIRETPTARWASANGAVFEPVGLWRRARYFPRVGEDMRAAVSRECLAVRASVGVCDASTLGKIAVVGPDALEFLNRIYANDFTRLAPGRCRYGLVLGEDGFIMDDGVAARLSATEFHVTTTTGGVDRVLAMMEDYRQTEWPDLEVWLTPVTERWAVIGVNGPNARRLLEPMIDGIDLSPDAFPHMSVGEGAIAGVPLRLFRVSFTGELGFEVNVPADAGADLWAMLLDRGRTLAVCPYGTEAMHVLRAEKGYVVPGHDTDGTVTPDDAGLAWAIGKAKPDFIGKRSLALAGLRRQGRKQLVGLLANEPGAILEEGAQIVERPDESIPMSIIGHVTSSYWSATLGRSIALALVKAGRQRMGGTVYVPMPERTYAATVVPTVFFDAEGSRLHG